MQDPKELKLFREGQELKDSTTLAEAKVENGDTLAMTYALPGASSCEIPPVLSDDAQQQACTGIPTGVRPLWQGKINGRRLTSPHMTTLESHDSGVVNQSRNSFSELLALSSNANEQLRRNS